MIKKVLGVFFVGVSAVCLYWGYDQYMEKTEGARMVDDFAESTGLSEILPEDATKPEMPDETKFALLGAAITGIVGVVLIIK